MLWLVELATSFELCVAVLSCLLCTGYLGSLCIVFFFVV